MGSPASSHGTSLAGSRASSPMETDDVSSSNLSPQSVYDEQLRRKKPTIVRPTEELCLVCGDRASGYHYNALTCEGCKGFFRRSITKNATYECKYGGRCEMDMYMRRKCQHCRLLKCKSVGMKPECLVHEPTRRQPKKREPVNKPNSTTISPPPIQVKEETPCGSTQKLPPGLTPEQQEIVEMLVAYQDQYELPSEDEIKKVTMASIDDFHHDESDPQFAEHRFTHITEWTILTVRLIVEFTKRLPGFETLCKEDQITLLKASAIEVILLRSARRYDVETDAVVFGNGQPYTRDTYRKAGVGDTADTIFEFSRSMAVMKVDNAEYALLTAIVIFSERPCLVEPRKIEKIQEIYLEALRAYTTLQRPQGPTNILARLLMKLTELRSFSNEHSEMLFSLKLQNHKLPPLLAEIWDVQ